MKKIICYFIFISITFTTFAQQMVVQKTDGSNLKVELNTIESINFIIPCPGTPTVDYGGKIYNTVLIGDQCWLKENLNVGTMIPGSQNPNPTNSTIEKWCYNNSEDSCTIYGGLYRWNEAMQNAQTLGAQGICPNGWHIPTSDEYQVLATYVDNKSNSLKAIGEGIGPDGVGTNTRGFTGLLAGGKWYDNSGFIAYDGWGSFWISQVGYSSIYAYSFRVENNNNTTFISNGSRNEWGFSVRCIKD
jgi:uncharacterized protein (TIGR02145 family)